MAVVEREDVLAAFLLGQLPEAEHDALEERLLEDGGLPERLDLARDDLIHAYLAGRLSAPERDAFEKHFLLSPRHRQRLDFVRDLVTATGRVAARAARPARRGWASRGVWGPLAAAVLIALAALVAVWSGRPDERPGQTAGGLSPSPPPTASAPSRPSPPPVERTSVEVVRLRPGGRDVTELPIGARTAALRVLVPVEPAPSYDAILSDADGREAWRAEDLTLQARGEPLAVTVPAEVFSDTDYVLSVKAEALRSASPAAVVRRLRVVRTDR